MNGTIEVNGSKENYQESQKNILRNEKQNPAGASTPGMMIEGVPGNKRCAGRASEEIAINGSVAGTAEMTGAWGK